MLKSCVAIFDDMEKELHSLARVFLNGCRVQSRLCGALACPPRSRHCCTAPSGPMARASGIESDTRKLGYEAYGDAEFDIITSTDCDGYARCRVRIGELFQSIGIIRQLATKVPDSPTDRAHQGDRQGRGHCAREAGPRGGALYYTKANGTKFLERFRVRTLPFYQFVCTPAHFARQRAGRCATANPNH